MSGLYGLVFGSNPHSGTLLQVLQDNAAPDTDFVVGRFRDAWLERHGEEDYRIHVYTRNGGGNRPDYEAEIASLRAHPWFLHDADDRFDSTYAGFWFKVPAELMDRMTHMAVEPVDTDKQWTKAIHDLQSGKTEPPPALVEAMGRVMESLADPEGGPKVIRLG